MELTVSCLIDKDEEELPQPAYLKVLYVNAHNIPWAQFYDWAKVANQLQ